MYGCQWETAVAGPDLLGSNPGNRVFVRPPSKTRAAPPTHTEPLPRAALRPRRARPPGHVCAPIANEPPDTYESYTVRLPVKPEGVKLAGNLKHRIHHVRFSPLPSPLPTVISRAESTERPSVCSETLRSSPWTGWVVPAPRVGVGTYSCTRLACSAQHTRGRFPEPLTLWRFP